MTGQLEGRGKDDAPPKSKKSVHYSFLRFMNKTKRRVDIVWLNYEGVRVKYQTLRPDQFVDINTFAGHPWVFFDADTGDRLVVQLKEIFEPIAWSSQIDGWPPQRKIVNITIPGKYKIYCNKEMSPYMYVISSKVFEKLNMVIC